MARKAREVSSTGIYAVILRGLENLFLKKELIDVFNDDCAKFLGDGLLGIRFYGDRVDMLVKESEQGISKDMKPLITSFARAYNRMSGYNGKVFVDRFKSVPVETEEDKAACLEYLDGGKKTEQYKSRIVGRTRQSDSDKVKKSAVPAVSSPEPEKKPKTKRDSMPSWLL